jgi:hypothetical protein
MLEVLEALVLQVVLKLLPPVQPLAQQVRPI